MIARVSGKKAVLTSPIKPPRTAINTELIPQAMKTEKRWLAWKWVWRQKANGGAGKWDKPPFMIDGRTHASSTDSTTWATFDEAIEAYKANPSIDGVGYALGDEWTGVDIDDCRDPDTGIISEFAGSIIASFDTYTEVSPSGTGVKIFLRGQKPQGTCTNESLGLEVYSAGRYFTVTGYRLDESPEQVRQDNGSLEWLQQAYLDNLRDYDYSKQPESEDLSDLELARQALSQIPSSLANHYGEWVRVGIAAKNVDESLREDWVAWSRGGSGYVNDDDCLVKWSKLQPNGKVGLGTLMHLAMATGWRPERTKQSSGHSAGTGSHKTQSQAQQPKTPTVIKVRSRRMDEVQSEQINWWWPGKIPRGNLIIFAGQGGCGKSSVCCDLIARHTTGQAFPNDAQTREPENVAIINCEDDASTIQRPRLDAAGADCSRVHLLDELDINGTEAWIDFSNFAKPVEDFIIENNITLLVVDPISGHIGGKKQNDTAEVREVLQKLQAMAKRTGCTIVAITHSPKAASSAQGAVIGSQAFVSCARAAFAFVVDKDDPKRRIMLNAKNNYSADETGLAYRIEDHQGVGRVEWEAEPVTEHPDTFFTPASQTDHSKQREVDRVAAILSNFLSEPRPKTEVDAWAKAHQISNATLRRAKDKNQHPVLKGEGGKWYWHPIAGATMWNGGQDAQF